MFWKSWATLPKGFPQEPNAGGSSETSEVSRLEMFPLSPLQVVMFCSFFFGGVGGGEASFLVVKKNPGKSYFVWLGVSKRCFFLSEFLSPSKKIIGESRGGICKSAGG